MNIEYFVESIRLKPVLTKWTFDKMTLRQKAFSTKWRSRRSVVQQSVVYPGLICPHFNAQDKPTLSRSWSIENLDLADPSSFFSFLSLAISFAASLNFFCLSSKICYKRYMICDMTKPTKLCVNHTRLPGYKTFFLLNSTEHEIFPAHKC